jgi:hypothetical protein
MRRLNGWICIRSIVYHGGIWMVVEGVSCHSCSSLLSRLAFDFGKEVPREAVKVGPVGDRGGEVAGVRILQVLGVDASDSVGNAGRNMTDDVEVAVMGELVSYQC